MDQIWPIEIEIIQFIQNAAGWLVNPMQVITNLGSETFFILWLPIILWCFDYGLGLKVGFILISSGQLFSTLKVALHSPRPFWFSQDILAYSIETGFGMPSGHSMNTMSIFGLIAASLKRTWVTWLAVVLILLVGLSRIILGMHFISDVLVGWLCGGLLLFFFVRYVDRISAWLIKQPVHKQYFLVISSAFAWILFCYLPYLFPSDWSLPVEWIDNAIRFGEGARPHPYSINHIYSNSGIWLGLGLGAIWLRTRGGYDVKGSGKQQLIRFLIGFAGTILIWMGLDKVFPDGTTLVPLIFRLIRYALVGFWVSGAAPEVFVRIKAAKRNIKGC